MSGPSTTGGRSIREQIENNLTIVLLGSLFTGFVAGFGTYKTILETAGQTTISKSDLDALQKPQQRPDAAPQDKKNPGTHKRVMTISDVQVGQSVEAFRLKLEINVDTYSLPVNSVWAERSKTTAPFIVSFPAASEGNYTIRFTAFLRLTDGTNKTEMLKAVDHVKDAELPTVMQYADGGFKIYYKIE
jgi:hypothetical protein